MLMLNRFTTTEVTLSNLINMISYFDNYTNILNIGFNLSGNVNEFSCIKLSDVKKKFARN